MSACLRAVGQGVSVGLLLDDIQAELKPRPYELVSIAFRTFGSSAGRWRGEGYVDLQAKHYLRSGASNIFRTAKDGLERLFPVIPAFKDQFVVREISIFAQCARSSSSIDIRLTFGLPSSISRRFSVSSMSRERDEEP